MSITKTVADTLVNKLAAHTWPLELTPERRYYKTTELMDLTGLEVYVIAHTDTASAQTRTKSSWTGKAMIVIQQPLADTETTTIDPLVDLVEAIAAHLDSNKQLTPEITLRNVTMQPCYSAAQLRSHKMFDGAIQIDYTITQERGE